MSRYNKILSQRLTTIENGLAAVQKTYDASRPSIFEEILTEGDRVLHPRMWDWVLEITEPYYGQRDQLTRIASLLAAQYGWVLEGGWGDLPNYWWALKGCTFSYGELNTDGLFYFFQCSRAEFDALPEKVRDDAWAEAVKRLTAVLRGTESCRFSQYRPEEARLLVTALSECNLSQLLRPYLPSRKICAKGSKEALAAWMNSEYVRQYAKRGHQPA